MIRHEESWLVQHPRKSGSISVVSAANYDASCRMQIALEVVLRKMWSVHVGNRIAFADEESMEAEFQRWLANELQETLR